MTISEVVRGLTAPRRAPLLEADAQLLQSGTPHTLRTDANTLAGWSWGAAGPRVLLVHGWESRASHFGQFVGPLCKAGFQVWAFDGPAHGDSSGSFSNVVHHGKAILAIAEAVGPFDALVAHSVGSPAALYAFHQGMRVRRSVHIAGPSSLRRVIHQIAQAVNLNAADTAEVVTLVEKHIGQSVASMELEALAEGLRHPALLLHDPADREVPYAESRALAQAWQGARLVDIAGAGHRRILGNAEAIAATVEHLACDIRLECPTTPLEIAGQR